MLNYNPDEGEWNTMCGACGHLLYAPTRGTLIISYKIHTHGANCLGGY